MKLDCLLVAGPAGAGKTTAARYLHKEFGVACVNTGTALARHMRAVGLNPVTRADIGPCFLTNFPPEAIFDVLAPIRRAGSLTLYDGIRLPITYRQVVDSGLSAALWYIDAPVELTTRRLAARLRNRRYPSAAIESELRTYSVFDDELSLLRELAHEVVLNDSTRDAFLSRINTLFLALLDESSS